MADLHFAPTTRARENLLHEGIGRDRIVVTGNTGIDALLWVSALLDGRTELRARVEKILDERFVAGKRMILMTGHRRESFDGGLARICQAMARIALRRDVAIVFPVHPNPNVQRATEPLHGHDNILLVEPVDYPELVFLLSRPSRNQTGISNAPHPRPYGLFLDDLPIHIRPDLPAARVQT